MEKKNKYYSLILFFSESEIGISGNRNKFVCVKIIHFDNGFNATEAYANTRCPASQLVGAPTMKELREEETKMLRNFDNPEWVDQLMESL